MKQKISAVMKITGLLFLLTYEFLRFLYHSDRDEAKLILLTD